MRKYKLITYSISVRQVLAVICPLVLVIVFGCDDDKVVDVESNIAGTVTDSISDQPLMGLLSPLMILSVPQTSL